jgi:hypothetical protein
MSLLEYFTQLEPIEKLYVLLLGAPIVSGILCLVMYALVVALRQWREPTQPPAFEPVVPVTVQPADTVYVELPEAQSGNTSVQIRRLDTR